MKFEKEFKSPDLEEELNQTKNQSQEKGEFVFGDKEKKEEEKEVEPTFAEIEEVLKKETGITRGVLQKIARSEKLMKSFRVVAFTVGLFIGQESFARAAEAVLSEKQKTEQQEKQDEKIEIKERNKKLLKESEYVVPFEVMKAFGITVDPLMEIYDPVGGYFKRDFLDTKEKRQKFQEQLKKLNYSRKEVERYTGYFKSKNIVFSERILSDTNFRHILAHERLHKELDFLPAKGKEILDKARDEIINDYLEKEKQWSAEQDSLFLKKLPPEEYLQKSKEIVRGYQPILLDSAEETQNVAPIIQNPDEFYPYLMMNLLSPRVEKYLQNNQPEAYKIHLELKDGIYREIEEKEKPEKK